MTQRLRLYHSSHPAGTQGRQLAGAGSGAGAGAGGLANVLTATSTTGSGVDGGQWPAQVLRLACWRGRHAEGDLPASSPTAALMPQCHAGQADADGLALAAGNTAVANANAAASSEGAGTAIVRHSRFCCGNSAAGNLSCMPVHAMWHVGSASFHSVQILTLPVPCLLLSSSSAGQRARPGLRRRRRPCPALPAEEMARDEPARPERHG